MSEPNFLERPKEEERLFFMRHKEKLKKIALMFGIIGLGTLALFSVLTLVAGGILMFSMIPNVPLGPVGAALAIGLSLLVMTALIMQLGFLYRTQKQPKRQAAFELHDSHSCGNEHQAPLLKRSESFTFEFDGQKSSLSSLPLLSEGKTQESIIIEPALPKSPLMPVL